MTVPVLKQGDYLIASIQSAVADADLIRLQEELAQLVGEMRCRGLIVDVTLIDVMDSFTIRTVLDITRISKLRGADVVVVGIQPDVAFAMVQLGLTLDQVPTALDLEEGLAVLASLTNGHDG